MRLEGRSGLITGAGSGMGAAAARLFAAEGAAVTVVDVEGDRARGVAAEITGAGGRAIAVTADVSQEPDVVAMVDAAVAEFGHLDVLYNNAGIDLDNAETADYGVDVFDRIVAVNLRGVFLGMKYGIPKMLEAGRGSIINTSSVAGAKGMARAVAYSASKFAVVGVTSAAAIEYGKRNIRANCIIPGAVETALLEDARRRLGAEAINNRANEVPLRRLGAPEDVARLALFLASDESSYITGAALPIDGGMLAPISLQHANT